MTGRPLRHGLDLAKGLVLLAAVMAASGARAAAEPGDMSLGRPNAPVTVVEYASLGCPHCATWAREVFPAFKRQFIDTGRVRFVLREMLTGDTAVAAAGFLTARCAGPAHYFQVVEGLFEAQPRMIADGDDMPSLLAVAAKAGLTNLQVSACLSDDAALRALNARADANAQVNHVDGTPTFDVNGKRFAGETSLAVLAGAIEAAQAAARRSR